MAAGLRYFCVPAEVGGNSIVASCGQATERHRFDSFRSKRWSRNSSFYIFRFYDPEFHSALAGAPVLHINTIKLHLVRFPPSSGVNVNVQQTCKRMRIRVVSKPQSNFVCLRKVDKRHKKHNFFHRNADTRQLTLL